MSEYCYGQGNRAAALYIAWPITVFLCVASLGLLTVGSAIPATLTFTAGLIVCPAIRQAFYEGLDFPFHLNLPSALVLASVLWFAGNCFGDYKIRPQPQTNIKTASVEKPLLSETIPLTPAQIAQQEADRQAAQQKQADDARKTRRDGLIKDVKVSEALLDGAIFDLKRGNLADADMQNIGAMLEIIYSTGHSLQTAWNSNHVLDAADKTYLKSVEAKLSSFQVQALPKLRSSFKKRVAENLWEHDVSLRIGGAGNTTITFVGFWFAANAQIKLVHDQLEDLFTRLRFKKMSFYAYDGADHGSYYPIEAPPDKVVAAYDNGFEKLSRGE